MKKIYYLCVLLLCAMLLVGCGGSYVISDTASNGDKGSYTGTMNGQTNSGETSGGSSDTDNDNNEWNEDGIMKILTIGNSFSVDSMEYVWKIADNLGVKASLGNLYIGNCSLDKHASNAANDANAYTYYTNSDGTWSSTGNYKMSDAIRSENWDFISLQQVSGLSGAAYSLGQLEYMINYVKGLCPDAKIVWNMTWAYQQNSTHYAFPWYNSDQMTMYNDITNVVQVSVCIYEDIYKVIPCGTAIQNVRTSYIGDTLTRDGFHLSSGFGRYVAGLTFVHTLTGKSIENVTYIPDDTDADMLKVAIESVTNAVKNPYSVTVSQYTQVG